VRRALLVLAAVAGVTAAWAAWRRLARLSGTQVHRVNQGTIPANSAANA